MTELKDRHCPSLGNTPPRMDQAEVQGYLQQLKGWKTVNDGWAIQRGFQFANYCETTAFVNAVVWIAQQQDHHPEIEFSYKNCSVLFSTHATGGLSEKDMICAARVDNLFADE